MTTQGWKKYRTKHRTKQEKPGMRVSSSLKPLSPNKEKIITYIYILMSA